MRAASMLSGPVSHRTVSRSGFIPHRIVPTRDEIRPLRLRQTRFKVDTTGNLTAWPALDWRDTAVTASPPRAPCLIIHRAWRWRVRATYTSAIRMAASSANRAVARSPHSPARPALAAMVVTLAPRPLLLTPRFSRGCLGECFISRRRLKKQRPRAALVAYLQNLTRSAVLSSEASYAGGMAALSQTHSVGRAAGGAIAPDRG